MNKKITFIGTGNMAGAIIRGLDGICAPESICLYDKDPGKYSAFSDKQYNIAACISDAFSFADYIFFAVKPQNFAEILSELNSAGISPAGKTVISIAAGITTDYICAGFGSDIAVIRTMPNTPALIGLGVTALSRNALVTDDAFSEITALFGRLGQTLTLPESKMNDIISVTSSSPAYVYKFIKAIYDTAREMGFDNDNLLEIICRMTIGSAEMAIRSGKTPDELITMVKSPKGTTEKALDKLDEMDFDGMIKQAMLACSKRAGELSRGF